MNKLKELLDEYKYYIITGLTILVVILMISLLFFLLSNDSQDNGDSNRVNTNNAAYKANRPNYSQRKDGIGNNSFQKSAQKFVDVKGAVKKPGVYQFSENMRVDDAINLAGGLNRSADRKRVDLAQKLNDQQVVYVPIRGEKTSNVVDAPSGNSSSSSNSDDKSSGQVNINDADKEKLQSINGVGDKRADKIIEYRKSHGDFSNIKDIKNIPGIGDKFFDNIKNNITT